MMAVTTGKTLVSRFAIKRSQTLRENFVKMMEFWEIGGVSGLVSFIENRCKMADFDSQLF